MELHYFSCMIFSCLLIYATFNDNQRIPRVRGNMAYFSLFSWYFSSEICIISSVNKQEKVRKQHLLFLNLFATGLPLTRPQGCCEKPDEGRVHLKMCVWLQASRRQFQELLSWKTAVQSILTWREVTTSIWQDVASCWGGSIALRDCWRMRLRQMFVTRSCNFWEWGPAFAQTPSFSL